VKTVTTSSDPATRVTFPEGGKRDDAQRTIAFHLLCPSALEAYARTCKEGSLKYGDRNWEKGIPTENYIDHALEHVVDAMHVNSPEGRLTELAHALWNIAAAIHNETGCTHHDWNG
jgi:Domain of unknown function (DUF5664)